MVHVTRYTETWESPDILFYVVCDNDLLFETIHTIKPSKNCNDFMCTRKKMKNDISDLPRAGLLCSIGVKSGVLIGITGGGATGRLGTGLDT